MRTNLTAAPSPAVELRAAVRFPLRISIRVVTETGEIEAMTVNISANGILFEMADPLDVGSHVAFTIPMPAAAMGTPDDVVVRCEGRVVRAARTSGPWQVAACIDRYYFSH